MAAINALVHDFVETAGHDLEVDDNPVRQAMVLRLLTERGSVLWDPTFGSTLYELPELALRTGVERVAEDRALAALAPLVKSKKLAQVQAAAQRTGRNRLDLTITARDAGWRPVRFSLFVAV